MAFVKKTWKNRISEFFNRYRVENVQTGAVSKIYMNLDDGAVTQEGDVIDADTMNDLEDRIEEALADVGKGSNWVGTTAEWNALTDAEKAEYDTYDLTDDFRGTGIDVNPTEGSSNVVTSGGVANHLIVGGRKFYFDYQDGKYGYNTSANRGADTFVPFKASTTTLTTKVVTTSTAGSGAKVSIKVYTEDNTQIAAVEPNTAGTTLYTFPTGLINYGGQSTGWIFKFTYPSTLNGVSYSTNSVKTWAYNTSVNYTITSTITL